MNAHPGVPRNPLVAGSLALLLVVTVPWVAAGVHDEGSVPTRAPDGCAPIIASMSPSGALVRDGNTLRFDAQVLCGGVSDITNDPATSISWSVSGGIGTATPATGNGTTFSATNTGRGQVAAYVRYYDLTAEARAEVAVFDGSGSCNTLTVGVTPGGTLLGVGQGRTFRAQVRCDANNVTSSSQIGWSVAGGIGSVTPASGPLTNFTASAAGPGRVQAGAHYGNQNLGGHAVVVVAPSGGTGAPYVTGSVPADGATGVPRNQSIEISFSAPMNATSTEAAVSASPAITGGFSWPSTSRIVWAPGALLDASRTYIISVSTAAKSQSGQNLARAHTFNFTTGTSGNLAPVILSTDPADGATGVPVLTDIVFEWNQDMQRATAEGATSAAPAITGTWQWANGDTRATWTPGSPLMNGTKYVVNVSTAATSQTGVTMAAPYSFSFTTASPPPPAPAVISTSPADKQVGVPLDAKIEVAFSLPMDTTATEGAVSFNPQIGGSYSWSLNDTRFVFTPSSPLQPSTNHSVAVSTGAKSKAGTGLPANHSFSFITAEPPEAPGVVSSSPADGQKDVPVGANIEVTFSLAMSKADTEGAFILSPPAAGAFGWGAGDTVLTFDPAADLQANTSYAVRIGTGAKSAPGVPLPAEHAFVFTTAPDASPLPPKVLGTDPKDGEKGVTFARTIAITFDQAMEKAPTEAATVVTPAAPGAFGWGAGDATVTLDPGADLQAGTSYTVTVGTGARSAKGLPLASPFSFTFTTATVDDKPPLVLHTPPGALDEGAQVEIKALVTDDSGVASVALSYRRAGESGFTTAAMSKGAGDSWVATIPGTAVRPERMEYYIEAADNAGNAGEAPPGAPEEVYAFAVRPRTGGPGPDGLPGGSVMIGGVAVPVMMLLLALLAVAGLLVLFLFMRRRRRPPETPRASFFDAAARVDVAQPSEEVVVAGGAEPPPPAESFEEATDEAEAPHDAPAVAAAAAPAAPGRDPPVPVEKDETPEALAQERADLKERIKAKRAARRAGSGEQADRAPG